MRLNRRNVNFPIPLPGVTGITGVTGTIGVTGITGAMDNIKKEVE